MKRLTFPLIASFACALWLTACAQDEAAVATQVAANATPTAAVETKSAGPAGDPCALIPEDEVRAAFAGAKSGARDHSLDKYDIATCTYETPTNTFVVQLFKAAGTVEDELKSRASGSVDPVKPGAGKHIRYEKFPNAGDDAMLAAEQGDAAEGLFNDIAVLVVRKGDRMAVLFARSLIDGDRTSTLASLAAVGHTAGMRL